MIKTIKLTDEQIDILLRLVDDEIDFTQQEIAWDKAHPNLEMEPAIRFPLDELNEIRKSLSV